MATEQAKSDEPLVDFAEFLEAHPPGSRAKIREATRPGKPGSGLEVVKPDIQLHCPTQKCGGLRIFRCMADSLSSISEYMNSRFLTYICRNCEQSIRVYALQMHALKNGVAEAYKIGEIPPFGPPVPPRVISLIGGERELFLKGRRAENQGLGVGAFAYYRRVVESQWQRLVDEIIRVAERVGASVTMIETLKKARQETQFSKAVEMVKNGIPEALKISGHNPLTLLYSPLSEGLHEQSDEYCLELASSVRVVLTELAERIGQALKDERELQEAVTRLLERNLDNGKND